MDEALLAGGLEETEAWMNLSLRILRRLHLQVTRVFLEIRVKGKWAKRAAEWALYEKDDP